MKKLLFLGLLGLIFSLSIANPGMAEDEFTEVSVNLEGISHSSAAFGDYDNDGDLDLLFSGITPVGNGLSFTLTKLYRNDSGDYIDTGVDITCLEDSICGWFDYDDDDDLDIFLSGEHYGATVSLKSYIYRNDGNDVFTPIPHNITPMSAGKVAFGDYDNDGDIDMLLIGRIYWAGPPYRAKLYRNDSGAFTEVTGLGFPDIALGGLAFGDYNNDGYLDILMSGTKADSTSVTKLYRSDPDPANPDDRIFTEITDSGLSNVKDGDLAFGDYNNDGYLDILLNGCQGNGDRVTKLYRSDPDPANPDNRVFAEVANTGLLGVQSSTLAFGDYNNDGYLDILFGGMTDSDEIVTKLYRNDPDPAHNDSTNPSPVPTDDRKFTGITDNPSPVPTDDRKFTEISTGLTGLRVGDFIWGDTDNDGDLDMLLTGSYLIGNPHDSPATKLYCNNLLSNTYAPNDPPDPPSMPTPVVNGSNVTLSWQKATDILTPQDGLSYNIFIGTNPNLVDTLSPMTQLSNGWRKISALGGQNGNTSWTIKNLADGTYYWGVQAIDTSFLGSPFALGTFTIGGPATWTISGTVTLDGIGLSGIDLYEDGTSNVLATTGPSGYYEILDLPDGVPITISPYGDPYTFDPTSRAYTGSTGNQANQDYVATLKIFTISGYVKTAPNDMPLEGVLLKDINNSNSLLAITDTEGFYSFTESYGWSGVVKPAKAPYSFNPVTRSYDEIDHDYADEGYIATIAPPAPKPQVAID